MGSRCFLGFMVFGLMGKSLSAKYKVARFSQRGYAEFLSPNSLGLLKVESHTIIIQLIKCHWLFFGGLLQEFSASSRR